MRKDTFQIILFDCPIDHLEPRETQRLFGLAMALRVRGYRSEHREGVLPVDTCDFIGIHQLVCQAGSGESVPMLGFRTVTLSRCDRHHLEFPALTLLKTSGASQAHVKAVQELIDESRRKGEELAYHSSWTIEPELRRDRALTRDLKDLVTAMLVHSGRTLGFSQSMLCGVPRFRTDEYFEQMGYLRLSAAGDPLPEFGQANLMGEPVVMMHRSRPSFLARRYASEFESVWNRRIEIGREQTPVRRAA